MPIADPETWAELARWKARALREEARFTEAMTRALKYEQALREVQELMTSGQYTVSQTWEKVAFIVHAALDKPG